MRILKIDGYDICEENGVFKNATFKDNGGKRITIELGEKLEVEFKERRKEEFREEYEKRKHIDSYIKKDYILETKISKDNVIDKEFIDEDFKNFIIKEIWKLPPPQNRRVFMNIINQYSFVKISKIEGVSEKAIRDSVKIGKLKLQKKLKKFLY